MLLGVTSGCLLVWCSRKGAGSGATENTIYQKVTKYFKIGRADGCYVFVAPECVAGELSERVGRNSVVSWASQMDVVGSGGSH